MRTHAILPLIFVILALGGGCFLFEKNPETNQSPADQISAGAAAIAPVLPGPLGGIVAGGATVLTLIGGIFAKRKVEEVRASVPDPVMGNAKVAGLNPVVKMLAERKWLFPIVSAVIAGGNAANLWHIDTEALLTLVGALNVPAVMEFTKDAKIAAANAAS